MKKIIIGLACVLALGGCAPWYLSQQAERDEVSKRPVTLVAFHPEMRVYRFVDTEAEMVCYVAATNTTAAGRGIACVPLAETALNGGR